MNVNDMGVAELRLAVQELRRYPAEVWRLEKEIERLQAAIMTLWPLITHMVAEPKNERSRQAWLTLMEIAKTTKLKAATAEGGENDGC